MARNIFTGEEIPDIPGSPGSKDDTGRNIYLEGKKPKQPTSEVLKENIKEFGQHLGEKGLDVQLGTLDLLEKGAMLPYNWLEYIFPKSKKAPGLTEQLQGFRQEIVPERLPPPKTRGGHWGSGVGTAIGVPIPGAIPMQIATGIFSGELQNLGVPPWLADLTGSLSPLALERTITQTPKLYRKGKELISKILPTEASLERTAGTKMQELIGADAVDQAMARLHGYDPAKYPEGYKPMTAEIVQEPGVSVEHRRRRELPQEGGNAIAKQMAENDAAINNALKSVETNAEAAEAKTFAQNYAEKREADLAALEKNAEQGLVEQTRRELGQASSAESAGSAIQSAIENERILLNEQRAPATAQYEAIQQSRTHRIPIEDTITAIEQELQHAKGEVASSLNRTRGYLQSNEGVNIAGREGAVIPAPTAYEIHNARGQLTDDINAAFKAGRTQEGHALKRVRDALDIEIAAKYPELTQANQAYRQQSTAYNALVDHPALGADIAVGEFGQGYKTQASSVPQKYISGKNAQENMQALLPILERHPAARQEMQQHVNSLLFENLFDRNGNITTNTLNTWRKNNKGAFVLDPTLDTKLGNISNARKYVNDIAKANEVHLAELKTTAAKEILNTDPNRLFRGIFERKNTGTLLDDAFNLAKRDPTGMATEGVKQAVINEVKNKVKSPAKYIAFFDKNKEHLAKHFSPNEMKVLETIDNAMAGRYAVETQLKPTGSQTHQLTHAANSKLGQFMKSIWKNTSIGKTAGYGGLGTAAYTQAGLPGVVGTAVTIASLEAATARANRLTEQVLTQAFVDSNFAKKISASAGIQREEAGVKFVEEALKASINAMNRQNAKKVQQMSNVKEEKEVA